MQLFFSLSQNQFNILFHPHNRVVLHIIFYVYSCLHLLTHFFLFFIAAVAIIFSLYFCNSSLCVSFVLPSLLDCNGIINQPVTRRAKKMYSKSNTLKMHLSSCEFQRLVQITNGAVSDCDSLSFFSCFVSFILLLLLLFSSS